MFCTCSDLSVYHGLSVYLLLRQNHFVAEPTVNLFLDHASASPAKVAVRRLVQQPLDHSMWHRMFACNISIYNNVYNNVYIYIYIYTLYT